MRTRLLFLCLLCCMLAGTAAAQESEGSTALHKGASEFAVWGGGGTGVGHSSDTQIITAGVRLGKVLTAPHGAGLLRGDLEYSADFVPLYLFRQDRPASGGRQRQTVYGGSITPLALKWNFISGGKVVPFIGVEGSAIFTTKDVPAGDTSRVNFASGAAGGIQVFTRPKRALTFSAHLMHISNASLGNHNPGVNVALQFRLGYQWWK